MVWELEGNRWRPHAGDVNDAVGSLWDMVAAMDGCAAVLAGFNACLASSWRCSYCTCASLKDVHCREGFYPTGSIMVVSWLCFVVAMASIAT